MFSKFKIILVGLSLLTIFSGCQRSPLPDENEGNYPPAVPENVRILRARDGEIILEWQAYAQPYLEKFNIYRGVNDSLHLKYYSFTKDLFFLDDSLEYDSVYSYAVSAVNKNGEESALSGIVSARPANYYQPFPPYSLHINARNWNDSLSVFLSWQPSYSTDIKAYYIYRGTKDFFDADSAHFVGSTSNLFFIDRNNLELLKYYYYRVRAVDKGDLIGNPTYPVKDVILDSPVLIYPLKGEIKGILINFKFVGCGLPARYKIVIQSNEQFGDIDEISLSSKEAHDTLSVKYFADYLIPGKTYYWRVGAYSGNSDDVNSFSKLGSFSITGR